MTKLSILIPTIKRHERLLLRLLYNLSSQAAEYPMQVEILVDEAENDSIGEKRNRLLVRAEGTYISFFDADDRPSDNYVSLLMEGINKGVDCCSLKGVIVTDGADPHYFEHSIRYKKYETVEGTNFDGAEIHYLRFPNHLNSIKAAIAKQFRFPEKNWGEDTDWATQIHESGLLKTEHYISEILYYYDYVSDKKQYDLLAVK